MRRTSQRDPGARRRGRRRWGCIRHSCDAPSSSSVHLLSPRPTLASCEQCCLTMPPSARPRATSPHRAAPPSAYRPRGAGGRWSRGRENGLALDTIVHGRRPHQEVAQVGAVHERELPGAHVWNCCLAASLLSARPAAGERRSIIGVADAAPSPSATPSCSRITLAGAAQGRQALSAAIELLPRVAV